MSSSLCSLANGHPLMSQLGYDRNRVIRNVNRNRILQKTIPVLSTGTGIFLTIPFPVEMEPEFPIFIFARIPAGICLNSTVNVV